MRISYAPHHFLLATYGEPYRKALEEAGHELVDDESGEVLFVDCDPPYDPWLTRCDRHERVVVYPHGAGITAYGAGQLPRHPHTVGQVVTGAGHERIADLSGDVPTVACGWAWTDLDEFTPSPELRRAFLAPCHPSQTGWFAPWALDGWRDMMRAMNIRYPDCRWDTSEGSHSMGETLDSIRFADLTVTSSATVLALAVAVGKPAVWFGPWRNVFVDYDDRDDSVNWPVPDLTGKLYGMSRYPYQGIDCVDDALAWEATAWRDQWIGPVFDPDLFVNSFESFVGS